MDGEQVGFWSRVAGRYDRVVDQQLGPDTRSRILARLEMEGPLGDCVEFGCGTGFYTAALVHKSHSLIATDISAGMLDVASRMVKAANLSFQQEDVQKTSFGDARFDSAFMSLVLHFTDPAHSIAEVRRILKDRGILIISNLDPGALTGLSRLRSRLRVIFRGILGYRTKPPKDFGNNVLSSEQLRSLLETSGFDVLAVETVTESTWGSHVPVEYVKAVKRGSL